MLSKGNHVKFARFVLLGKLGLSASAYSFGWKPLPRPRLFWISIKPHPIIVYYQMCRWYHAYIDFIYFGNFHSDVQRRWEGRRWSGNPANEYWTWNSICIRNRPLALSFWLEQVLNPIGPLIRTRQCRNSKIKYKFIYLQGVFLGVAVPIVEAVSYTFPPRYQISLQLHTRYKLCSENPLQKDQWFLTYCYYNDFLCSHMIDGRGFSLPMLLWKFHGRIKIQTA